MVRVRAQSFSVVRHCTIVYISVREHPYIISAANQGGRGQKNVTNCDVRGGGGRLAYGINIARGEGDVFGI